LRDVSIVVLPDFRALPVEFAKLHESGHSRSKEISYLIKLAEKR
jgi:hypothetical protein